MKRMVFGLIVAAMGAPVVAHGQHMIASAVVQEGYAGQDVAQRKVDVQISIVLNDVLLSDAIREVSRKSGVQVMFASSAIPERRVSYTTTNASVHAILGELLKGTNLVAEPGQHGAIKLVQASRADGVIVGKVVNAKTKQPVSGATVSVDGVEKPVVTGADGTFRVVVPAGEQKIRVRALGLARREQTVVVGDAQTVSVEVVLEPAANVLGEVVVTGTVVATERKAIPTPITVITAEEIEKRGITRVEDLLRGGVPGVLALEPGTQRYKSTAQNGGADTLGKMISTSVYSRGNSTMSSLGRPNPLKTFIDGVELLDPSYLGTIDPQTIERIEIITGPQAATIYGSGAMGGVMQIFTKKGSGEASMNITTRLRYSVLQNNFSDGYTPAHNHSIGAIGGIGPTFSYSGNLSYNYTGQWQPALYARSYGGSLGATLSRAPLTATGAVSMTVGSNGTSGQGSGIASSPLDLERKSNGEYIAYNVAGYYSQRIARSNSQTLSLNIDYRQSDYLQHHLTVGRSQTKLQLDPQAPIFEQYDDTLFKSSTANGDRTTASYNLTVVPSRLGVMSSTITVGMNGSWGEQTQFTGCLASETATSYVVCESYPYELSITKTLDSKNWGGFGTMQVGVWDRLYLTFGLRGERNPAYGREHAIDWTPTNGVAYTVEMGDLTMKFLGSYGRATRPPRPNMRLSVITNTAFYTPSSVVTQLESPSLTPEYSRGPQGGVEIYYGNLGSLSINRYVQKITDLIESVKIDSVPRVSLSTGAPGFFFQYQYLNTATIRQHGWEGTGSLNLGPLSLKGTYSWNDSRVLSSRIASYYKGRSFIGVPTHTGNVTIDYALGNTSIGLVTNYVGERIATATATENWAIYFGSWRIPSYIDRKAGVGTYVSQPGYTKTDLTISQRLSSWATASVNVLNLGNSYTSDVSAAFPTLGRQTAFGLALRFPK